MHEPAPGESLFETLKRCDQPVASSCRGNVVCGRCIVRVVKGGQNLSTMEDEERAVLLREGAADDERLACRAYLEQDEVTLTTGYW
jgi:ferredoxin